MIQPQYSSPHAIKQQYAPASVTINNEDDANTSSNIQYTLQQEQTYNLVEDSSNEENFQENSSNQIHSKIVLLSIAIALLKLPRNRL